VKLPIIGVGAVASIGGDPDEIHRNLCAGRSGLGPLRGFTRDWYTADRLCEIDDRDTGTDVPGRATGFLCEAVAQALDDAGIGDDLTGIPVLIGTGLRELRSVELWARDDVKINSGALHFGTALRRLFGATDSHTFAGACSASLYALALGTDLLESGAANTVVVAGADAITESMFAIADRLQSVPPDAVRPFDRKRLGTILGEGASCVVLRREAAPVDRVRGWVRSVAVNCDARHATAPDPASIVTVIRDAHDRADVTPADIDLLMLHGTGTPANDTAEATAVSKVFTPDSTGPLMTAIKSMTGHTSGASGLHALITAAWSMTKGIIPPTISVDDPIDEIAGLQLVRGTAQAAHLSLAQVNAFGFGGVNAVAVVEAAR
jgi:3-oxoacyl-[acyl-carrier-protein] synthase II